MDFGSGFPTSKKEHTQKKDVVLDPSCGSDTNAYTRNNQMTIHPITWLIWLGVVLGSLSITRNPLYLTLILLCLASIIITVRPHSHASPVPISLLKFAIIITIISALFNALMSHVGNTVLFVLPNAIPFFGGNITLEALVFGALNGLVLSGLFTAFTILNMVIPTRSLVRLIPRAFYPIAIVISIAITFVPSSLRQLEQIRQAQAIRGHKMKYWQDWLPLLIPLLIGSLERALQLAESMTARGFATVPSDNDTRQAIMTKLVFIIGMSLLVVGWMLRLAWGYDIFGLWTMIAGSGFVIGMLWYVGRRIQRTVYRTERWTTHDSVITIISMLVIMPFLFSIPFFDHMSLFYYPYPSLTLPKFDPYIGLLLLGILTPLLGQTNNEK